MVGRAYGDGYSVVDLTHTAEAAVVVDAAARMTEWAVIDFVQCTACKSRDSMPVIDPYSLTFSSRLLSILTIPCVSFS